MRIQSIDGSPIVPGLLARSKTQGPDTFRSAGKWYRLIECDVLKRRVHLLVPEMNATPDKQAKRSSGYDQRATTPRINQRDVNVNAMQLTP
ncbi:hypothetical protein RSAG8_03188, partial [Rhizoctonia solani AG-8 WAC10335]